MRRMAEIEPNRRDGTIDISGIEESIITVAACSRISETSKAPVQGFWGSLLSL